MKRCPRCGNTKLLDEFGVDRNSKDGHRCYCKECNRTIVRTWREANPEKDRAAKTAWHANNRDYDRNRRKVLADKYGDECRICHKQDVLLVIDHCHTTGLVRGLLCHHCNVGIGFFFDNPVLLRAAAKYLLPG